MRNIYQLFALIILISCSQEEVVDMKIPTGDREKNMLAGEIFLQANLSQSGVIEVEPGLQYLVLNEGDLQAKKPKPSDKITAHFHGTLLDGTVFWSSVDMNDPLIIKPSQLIPGCQKILPLMRIGDKWRVFIHPDMAYGEEGRPTIPPNSVLTFDIELLAVN
jgi:FKBP-type peptidyl-prolyl cis-trans isomerase